MCVFVCSVLNPWLMSPGSLHSGNRVSRAYTPCHNVGFGVSEFIVPPAGDLVLQRLAGITAFVCSDRGTVCEDEPVVDTIYLMKGADHVAILDLHADEVCFGCVLVVSV